MTDTPAPQAPAPAARGDFNIPPIDAPDATPAIEPKDHQARVAVVSIVGLTLLGMGLIVAAIVAMLKGQVVEAAVWTVLGTVVGSLATGLNPPGGAVSALREAFKGASQ